MKSVGILQPGYLPWLGFFDQIRRCDIFVLYDDVQYDKNGWRNRNRIKTNQGLQWLTVPVLVKDKPLITEVKINSTENWREKHIKSIKQNYTKAVHFSEYFPIIEKHILNKSYDLLVDLDIALIKELTALLGIETEIVRSSNLPCAGDRITRLVNIVKYFGGNNFVEGSSGKNYIDDTYFLESGISITYQDYKHPIYPQLYSEFIPHASIIDLLFNCGKDSLKILINEV